MNFIYLIRPKRDNFIETITDEESNIMSEHFEYLKNLLKKGKLVLAGPVTSGKFGIVILEAEDESKAQNIMLNDPAVASSIVSSELYPFRISLMKK